MKAGLEREKTAFLVVIAALSDGSKRVLSAEPGYRESVESWSETLRSLKSRGMNCPRLVVGDGHLGIWGALRNVYPEADEQRCWNHKLLNVLDRLPKRDQAQAKMMLKRIPYAESRREAERLRSVFSRWCAERGHESGSGLGEDGCVLRLSQGTPAASSDDQPGGITVRVVETED